jgi:hypothetical protein
MPSDETRCPYCGSAKHSLNGCEMPGSSLYRRHHAPAAAPLTGEPQPEEPLELGEPDSLTVYQQYRADAELGRLLREALETVPRYGHMRVEHHLNGRMFVSPENNETRRQEVLDLGGAA